MVGVVGCDGMGCGMFFLLRLFCDNHSRFCRVTIPIKKDLRIGNRYGIIRLADTINLSLRSRDVLLFAMCCSETDYDRATVALTKSTAAAAAIPYR